MQDTNRPNPDELYWDAVDNVLESFNTGDIPADCRELAEHVERFSREVEQHDKNTEINPHQQHPHESFWRALDAIRDHINGKIDAPLPPLETIQELRDQNVDDNQIAKMYGFIDRRGNPMPWLVKRELEKPGSVLKTPGAIDGRDWMDPRLKDVRPTFSRDDEAEAEKMEAAEVEAAPCPETPRELWEQDVPAAQAAKMLRRPLAEVEAEFQQLTAEREKKKKKPTKEPEAAGTA